VKAAMPSPAVDAYVASCETHSVKPRQYLIDTLGQINKEMQGQQRAGFVNLAGNSKPLFKNRLTDKDVVCFFDGLDALLPGFSAAEINLSKNRVGIDGVRRISEFLKADGVRVEALDLSGNDIDGEGIQSLVEVLKTPVRLEALDVSSNDIGAKGVMDIVTALEENRSLTHLNIGQTGFESSSIIALCDILRHRRNTSLNSLGLSTPFVSKRSVPCHTIIEHIGLMLKHNQGIRSLDLTAHRIDDRGAEILCAYLCTTDSVEDITLTKNNIGIKGAAAFAALLVDKNCAVQHLDLARNNIANDGAIALAKGLGRNQTVVDLDLSDNNIENQGLLDLQRAATNHGSLRSLRLFAGNQFGVSASEYAQEHPLSEEEFGGVQVDFKGFIVDGEVQIARVDI